MDITLLSSPTGQFICERDLDLYDQPDRQTLATQAGKGRFIALRGVDAQTQTIEVYQWEDGYSAWLDPADLQYLTPVDIPYQAPIVNREDIEARIPEVLAFIERAGQTTNQYRWGSNIGPDYDCSGLMQAAFASQGIWLPRDSYQQGDFCAKVLVSPAYPQKQEWPQVPCLTPPIDLETLSHHLQPGDLLFFGSQRVDHVGIYLGSGHYIHCSGKSQGRNGIGQDSLTDFSDPISAKYGQKWWYAGRVMASFDPHRHNLTQSAIAVDTSLLR